MPTPAPAPTTVTPSPWPWVALAVGLSLAVSILAAFMPESRWVKTGEALAAFGSTPIGVVIYGLLGAIAVAVLRAIYLHIPAKYRDAIARASIVPPLLVLAFLAAGVVVGCGPSAIRTHATLSHTVHEALELAGSELVLASDSAIAACPHDDGAERASCLEHIDRDMSIAGAARDALILPSNAYRAAILRACDVDPSSSSATVPADCPDPPPEVLDELAAMAATITEDLPAFLAALDAFGIPRPEGL